MRHNFHLTLINHIMGVLHEESYGKHLFPRDIANSDTTSAVLFLLAEHCENDRLSSEPCVVFNKRSMLVRQPGDLCFPGGRIALHMDYYLSKLLTLPLFPLARWPYWVQWRNSLQHEAWRMALLIATGLRESLEEMRLNPFRVKFLGPLPPHNLDMFRRVIYPMVGWIKGQKHFLLNWEVEKVVYVPIRNLLNTNNYACYRLNMKGRPENERHEQTQDFPCFRHETQHEREVLWGATYWIVMIFLELIVGFTPPGIETLPVIHGSLDESYFNRGR